MEDLTGKQFGPYQIVAPLGEGGMAAVYKAYQGSMDRYVAVKVLPRQMAESEEFIARFKREARMLAQLQHPHILPVFDYGESEGYTYIVMPFVQSGTLADVIRGRRMSMPEIRRIMTQVGDALAYAHARGMIHRDVKPSNVLVDERGNCLLTDFGLARMTEATSKLTSSGAIMGTPAYMSPEQGAGKDLDGRSDIYSLGIIMYELVTGRVPYYADTPIAIVFKHIQDPLPSARNYVPDLPDAVERVLLKCLSKSPEERYQTADDFVQAIQNAIPGAGAASAPAAENRTALAASAPPPVQATAWNPLPPSNPASSQPVSYSPPASMPRSSSASISQPRVPAAPNRLPLMVLAGAGIGVVGIIAVIVLAIAIRYYNTRVVTAPNPTRTSAAATSTPQAETPKPTDPAAPAASATVALLDPPTVAVPSDRSFVRINNITVNPQGQYVVDYETFQFTEKLPGMHVHFVFDTVPEDQAGMPGRGPWKLYGGPRPFVGYRTSDRPKAAAQMCAYVARANHSIFPQSGNCFPLPDVPTLTMRTDTSCYKQPAEDAEVATTLKAGMSVLLHGTTDDHTWFSVFLPRNDKLTCWVSHDSGVLNGDPGSVPVVTP